jgi:hypothetical protein
MATIRWWKLALWASIVAHGCRLLTAQQPELSPAARHIATRHTQRSEQFLKQRGLNRPRSGNIGSAELLQKARAQHEELKAKPSDSGTTPLGNPWTSIGPSAVETSNYGLITGRISSIAVDPSDTSGNTVYVGSTGGGVWKSTNAAGPANSVTFTPLTDTLSVSSNCGVSQSPQSASLSIGALTVQPGGTGVILAGTGDPTDPLVSYYGTGILRSTDRGNTWCLTTQSADPLYGSLRAFSFRSLGFAGFAWSTVNPQLVVAAVSQSAEGVAADFNASSFAGLYYSSDAGQSWRLATIEDSSTQIVQSSQGASNSDPGNSATSVTWNPVRQRFYAAVRYHGYYESSDGIIWTRLAHQPGVNLFPAQCPTNASDVGSAACPIFRGTITAQSVTGDLFALTVDNTNSDQGLWQDACHANASGCASATVTFSNQIADDVIDTGGGTNIPQGDYDLSLAAVPSQQDTLLFVGTKDIFRCSLANSCVWRNTTNVDNCAAAQVAPSEHAFDATFGSSSLIYFGNDGGLWRTTDAVNQTQPTCSADDSTHFQNLNSGIGSLAEIASFSQHPQNENVLMAAMGAFGTAAPQVGSSVWAQILDGEGDVNAIDPQNPQNWYATSASPIDINFCAQGTACNKSGFGLPVIDNTDVGNDGYGLSRTATWILDPQDTANMIVGTCRVWRGSANGTGWVAADAISPMLDTIQNSYCAGNAQIRSLAASGSPNNPPGAAEKIYAGMAGSFDGGATVAGHVYAASASSASSTMPTWSDLSNSPILNSPTTIFNAGGFDISSIYVDPHDSTGNTVYVSMQGFITAVTNGFLVYRTIDGGAHWIQIAANLPDAPVNSILVDPNDANTVYVALDTGVYVTRNINLCTDSSQDCWSVLGTGLPGAPVTQLQAINYGSAALLRASTYGRGLWQIPLVTAGITPTSATLSPASLTFAGQAVNTLSSAESVTLTNTGTFTLTISSIAVSQNFVQQNNCALTLKPGDTCAIQVSFAPASTGALQGTLTVFANVPTGQVSASLSGTGLPAGNIVLSPTSLAFGSSIIGTKTAAQNLTISNTGGVSVTLQTPVTTGDFPITANTCGTSLAPNSGCTISIAFNPTAAGGRAGVFTISDDEGTQTAQLSGNGQATATAVLSGNSLNFSQPQMVGIKSGPQQVTLTNNGDVSLTDIAIGVTGDFTAQNNCGSFLVGHASCAVSVNFVPTKIGAETGVLTMNTQLGAQTVALSGTGLAPPGVSALPATLNFGGQAINSTSSPQRVVVTNSGGSPLTGLTFSITGDYAVSGTNCPSGQTLNAPGNCYIDITFTPSQAGQRSGSLTVGATNLSGPFDIALTGTGDDFQLLVTGSSSAVIVTGQTATYAIQVVPVNGSAGTLTMGCTGVPQNATCTLNPATLPIASGVTGYATVTIASGTAATTSSAIPGHPWKRAGVTFAALLPFVVLGTRKRRTQARGWFVCFLGLSLGIVLLIPAACGTMATGGGKSTSPPPPPQGPATPSGVYTLNITASMPGLQRSVPITLTVQ